MMRKICPATKHIRHTASLYVCVFVFVSIRVETQHCKLSFTSNVDFSLFYHNDDFDVEEKKK